MGEERLLALADALATQLVSSAEPVTFRVANSRSEREAIFRLRYRTVVESSWAQPADLPGGMERDEFDDRALHLGGWDGAVLAACARLVFPSPGTRLPTEDAFDLEVRPPGTAVDLGRGIVAPPYRDAGHRVLMGLLARCWIEIRARDYSRVVAAAPGWLLDVYRRIGFTVEVIGPPRRHWGEDRSPILIDGVASVLDVMRRVESGNTR